MPLPCLSSVTTADAAGPRPTNDRGLLLFQVQQVFRHRPYCGHLFRQVQRAIVRKQSPSHAVRAVLPPRRPNWASQIGSRLQNPMEPCSDGQLTDSAR